DTYSVYGWKVAMHRDAREFSGIRNVGRNGFTIWGSGSATVTTRAIYSPGADYKIGWKEQSLSSTSTVTASPSGRLVFEVPLGQSNPYQQFTLEAMAAGTKVFTTKVSIEASQ